MAVKALTHPYPVANHKTMAKKALHVPRLCSVKEMVVTGNLLLSIGALSMVLMLMCLLDSRFCSPALIMLAPLERLIVRSNKNQARNHIRLKTLLWLD
uniref:Uncharacterized protein n=1 Tax=Arundo donax TaxID=35708 RepID=A0A0A9CIX7_ARUDO